MRITCPNCAAEYEVDAALIPEGGRDVQCSDCGHTWMQYPDGGVEEIGSGTVDPEEDDEEMFGPEPDEEPEPEPEPAPRAESRREIDEETRRILREEAAREAEKRRARRAEQIETQTDLGLEDRPKPARARTERPHREIPEGEDAAAALGAIPAQTERESVRGHGKGVFPDIEEINSTLTASGPPEAEAEAEDTARRSGGFRSGFFLVLLLGLLVVALYLLAPRIAAAVPSLEPALVTYVNGVNGFRMSVETLLHDAASWIEGLSI